jgi:DNA-binding transcriptional LysR family regulator
VSFLLGHPNIDVDLEEQSSHLIVQALAAGRADIGIVASSVDLGQLQRTVLRDDNLVLLTAPGHLLARRRQITFHECLDQPFVGLSAGSALQEHLEGQALPLGQKPHYRVRLPNVETVCRAVAAGVGVGILPQVVVRQWRRQHPLATIPLRDPWADRQLVLCTKPGPALSAPTAALLDHLVSQQAARRGSRNP